MLSDLELRLLGPVELRAGGRTVSLGSPQWCAVLAALAVDAGRPVSTSVMMDRVWGLDPPEKARRNLHPHIARIRRTLERSNMDAHPVSVVRRGDGYALEIDPNQVDLHRFQDLVNSAEESTQSEEQQSMLLREALALWRGQPLAGVPGQWAARMRQAWQHQRVDAMVALAAAELRLGNPSAVIGMLTDLVDEHPLVESLTVMLMRAHHAAGHSALALSHYTTIRRRLVEELGVDPGTELQQVHQAILRGDLDRPAPAARQREPHTAVVRKDDAATVSAAISLTVPWQLPSPMRHFVGRTAELEGLTRLASEAAGSRGSAVVTAISGTGGIGKTALALQLAHIVASRFPDGQIYMNLRGFDPSGSPMAPAEAIRLLLDSLGVAKESVPLSLEAQVALYRTLVAGRRLLIVLDNARDSGQIHPLLPGTPGCMVVVTSRNELTGLIAAGGVHPITLDLLTDAEAAELLTRRLGTERIAGETQAVDALITGCARLPLALAIAASRAVLAPHFPLSGMAAELDQVHRRLDVLDTGDQATQLRSVFSWSYEQLSPPVARLFRLLGVHPGPDLTVPAATALIGSSISDTQGRLDELTKAHLLSEHKTGRYMMHDLLRAYAAELTHAQDNDIERLDALHRTLDYYLHTANLAATRLNSNRAPTGLASPHPAVTIEDIGTDEQAIAWFEAEYQVLLGAIRRANEAESHIHVGQLAWAMTDFFDRRALWRDWAAIQTLALEAAMRLDDPLGRAQAHRSLGRAHHRLEQHDDAIRHHHHARDAYGQIGDQVGEAHSHFNLARSFDHLKRYDEALNHSMRALDLYRAAGHKPGLASALNFVGAFSSRLGNHEQGLAYSQEALAMHQELGNRAGEARTLYSIGIIHHNRGEHEQAIVCLRKAFDLEHDRFTGALSLWASGSAHQALGDVASALDAWQRALRVFTELGHPFAAQVQTRLAELER